MRQSSRISYEAVENIDEIAIETELLVMPLGKHEPATCCRAPLSPPLRVKFRVEDLVLPSPQDKRLRSDVWHLGAHGKPPTSHVFHVGVRPAIEHRVYPTYTNSIWERGKGWRFHFEQETRTQRAVCQANPQTTATEFMLQNEVVLYSIYEYRCAILYTLALLDISYGD